MKSLFLFQFMEMPPFGQNIPVIYHLLRAWDSDEEVFVINGQRLPFLVEEVAQILGFPNAGEEVTLDAACDEKEDANEIRNKIKDWEPSGSADGFVSLFIKFLFSNLLFCSTSYKIKADLLMYAENLETFARHNWASAVHRFLKAELDVAAGKVRDGKPMGYSSGFLGVFMIWFLEHTSVRVADHPDRRPRFMRWSSAVGLKPSECLEIFGGHKDMEVFISFRDVLPFELQLAAGERPMLPELEQPVEPTQKEGSGSPPPASQPMPRQSPERPREEENLSERVAVLERLLRQLAESFGNLRSELDVGMVRVGRLEARVAAMTSEHASIGRQRPPAHDEEVGAQEDEAFPVEKNAEEVAAHDELPNDEGHAEQATYEVSGEAGVDAEVAMEEAAEAEAAEEVKAGVSNPILEPKEADKREEADEVKFILS